MKKLPTLLGLLMSFSCLLWSQASVQVIHNSPTPGTDSGPTVDVYVNGGLLPELTAVPFRAATAFLEVPSGVDIEVGVAVSPSSGPEDAIATFPLGQLEDGGNYVVTANGIVGNAASPFNLAVNAAGQQTSAPGTVGVAAFHGSPGAPNVDIAARNVGDLFVDLPYNEYSEDYLAVPADSYILDVSAAGNEAILASFQADLSGLDGGAATVFASGILGDTPAFGLFAALPDGTVVELPAVSLATLQVIHNSPSPTVDVYVNGDLLLDDFAYLTATPFVEVPAGVELNIAVAPETSSSADDAIYTTAATLDNGENYVAIANGIVGDADFPFELVVTGGGQLTGNDPTGVEVLGFHGIPGASAVDVFNLATESNTVDNISYGEFAEGYASIPPTFTFLEIRPSSTEDVVGTFAINLVGAGGLTGVVFAGGLLEEEPLFNLYLVLPDGQVFGFIPASTLQLVHNSPAEGAANIDLYAAVDPESTADFSPLLEDFSFRTATPGDSYFVSRTSLTVGVAPGDSDGPEDIFFQFPAFTLEDGKQYIAFANGIPGDPDNPLTLEIKDTNPFNSSDESTVGLTVFHGSPGAPNVDVTARSNGATLVDDLAYGNFTDYTEIPAAAEYLEVRATGDDNLVGTFDATVLEDIGGLATTVFASGILGDDPAFGLFAVLPNGTVAELGAVSRMQIIHNSPSPTVDIYVNGANAVPGLEFRTATGMVDLPSRTPLDIAVVPAGGELADAVATLEDVSLEDGKVYLAMANGVVGDADTPFEVVINDQGRDRSADDEQVDLVLFHGSPDAPDVDVVVDGGPILFDDITYGTFSDYLGVAPAGYILNITPATDNTSIVKQYDADLSTLTGQAAVVFASGFLGSEPEFETWVALTDGTTFPLMEVVSTNDIPDQLTAYSVFPNPVRDLTNVEFNLKETTEISFNLVNPEGKVLLNRSFGQLNAGDYREQLNLGNLPAGLYQLLLVTPEGQATQPVLIVK